MVGLATQQILQYFSRYYKRCGIPPSMEMEPLKHYGNYDVFVISWLLYIHYILTTSPLHDSYSLHTQIPWWKKSWVFKCRLCDKNVMLGFSFFCVIEPSVCNLARVEKFSYGEHTYFVQLEVSLHRWRPILENLALLRFSLLMRRFWFEQKINSWHSFFTSQIDLIFLRTATTIVWTI